MRNAETVNLVLTLALQLLKNNAEGSRLAGRALSEGRVLTPEEMDEVERERDAAIDSAQRAIDAAQS